MLATFYKRRPVDGEEYREVITSTDHGPQVLLLSGIKGNNKFHIERCEYVRDQEVADYLALKWAHELMNQDWIPASDFEHFEVFDRDGNRL